MMGREQWTYVDKLNKPPRLRRGDACFYYLVYTPHAGYGISNANGIVLNYKIPIGGESGLRNRPQRRRYKDAAIAKYAEAIVDFIEGKRIRATGEELAAMGGRVGLLPVPPSYAIVNPDYDDRNVQTCKRVHDRFGFRVCRDIETTETVIPSHNGGNRSIDSIMASMRLVGRTVDDCDFVFVIDDVLVTGAHFVAVKSMLQNGGYERPIIGLFLARAMY